MIKRLVLGLLGLVILLGVAVAINTARQGSRQLQVPPVQGVAVDGCPGPAAAAASGAVRTVNRTVRELFPGTLVAPGLMLGATDARHFEPFTEQVFRFSPIRAKAEDLARFHGTNERISLANLADLIRFYHRLVQQTAGPAAAAQQTASR